MPQTSDDEDSDDNNSESDESMDEGHPAKKPKIENK